MADSDTAPRAPPASVGVAKVEARSKIEVAQIELIKSLGIDAKDLATEFIRAASNNPIVGVATVLIFADVLYRLKIIDQTTFTIITGFTGVAFGVSVAESVGQALVGDLGGLIGAFTGKSSNPPPDPAELIKPVAGTIVYPASPNTPRDTGSTAPAPPALNPGMLSLMSKIPELAAGA